MRVDLRYLSGSTVTASGGDAVVSFAPNLARPRVAFDGGLRRPLRYREAMSALHEVVVGDLRPTKKDRGAWESWKVEVAREEQALREFARERAQSEHLAALKEGPPAGLKEAFKRERKSYWKARNAFLRQIHREDPRLYRKLVPLDPVVTVAPDVVFFECFSKDGSSYGSLMVDRDAFTGAQDAECGTTNVDYSLPLYEHFQKLRTYRSTRLRVDPQGFEVEVAGSDSLREEKIDLPPSWLRGFGQLQSAMALPTATVSLPVEALYSVLAHLKRNRERRGPRCLRFELIPGEVPQLYLDPWGTRIPCLGAPPWQGDAPETVKVWGRRRLMVLSRLLPMADGVDVHLLGSGLPHIWVVRMGELRFVLGLSGWTANSWTAGANLDLLAGVFKTDAATIAAAAQYLSVEHAATLSELMTETGQERTALVGALHQLAKQGQIMVDHARGCYRWRQVMPVALSAELMGPENPELTAARTFLRRGLVHIARREQVSANQKLVMGSASGTRCETLLNSDGQFLRARCTCSHFYKNKLRGGPCRHLLALKLEADDFLAHPSRRWRPGV